MKLFPCLLVLLVLNMLSPARGICTETEPPLWTSNDTFLTAVMLTSAGALSLVDEDVRHNVRSHQSNGLDFLSDGLDLIGHPATGLGVAASLLGYGWWRDDPELAETGRLSLQAVVLADLTTLMVKGGVGRLRPDEHDDAASFRPFSFENDRESLPSGHTASSFALAAVLSRRSQSPSAPFLYYGLASLVALSRVYDDEHWMSDILTGALVGELSGRLVMANHARNLSSAPLISWNEDRVLFGWQARW